MFVIRSPNIRKYRFRLRNPRRRSPKFSSNARQAFVKNYPFGMYLFRVSRTLHCRYRWQSLTEERSLHRTNNNDLPSNHCMHFWKHEPTTNSTLWTTNANTLKVLIPGILDMYWLKTTKGIDQSLEERTGTANATEPTWSWAGAKAVSCQLTTKKGKVRRRPHILQKGFAGYLARPQDVWSIPLQPELWS